MADISCPACGKLNPAGELECQFCHAVLLPEPPPSSVPPVEDAPHSDVPNSEPALSETPPTLEEPGSESSKATGEIGQEAEASNDESLDGQEGESETPEWLRRIRNRLVDEKGSSRYFRHRHEQEPGEGFQEEQTPEEPSLSSRDFSVEIEPGPQPGDTLPSVPERDYSIEPVEYQEPVEEILGAGVPELIVSTSIPPAFSYNLRLTGSQHAHADLLSSVIEAEGIPIPVARRRRDVVSPLLRWGIAAVLMISILLPIVLNRQESPLPLVGEETGQVNNLIEQLPEEANVLVAFDYEPGFSGELGSAATAVIDHLLAREAYLTLVSTLPTGPVIAERFFANMGDRVGIERNTSHVNLGFIPGGPAGLLSFAENMQSTMPFTLEGEPAWAGSTAPAGSSAFLPLDGITEITDFDLVLILVDDPATARSWIEQVQPLLAGETFSTPMAMVVSAGAAPVVRPYYESNPRQVQGIVAGFRGATAYQQLTGRVSQQVYYWDAFNFGMNTAGLLILLGAVIGMAYSIFRPHDQEGEGGRV